MPKTPIVYFARHGTTALNKKDFFRGPLDVPLDSKGIRDAHQLGYYFSDCDLFPTVFCSTKKRTQHTARIITGAHESKLDITPNSGLCAWNVGFLGGKEKNAENLKKIDYYCKHPDEVIPDGESLNEFKARVRPLFVEAIEAADRSGLPILFVVHSSVIHEIGSMLYGDHKAVLVEPGGVAAIFYDNGNLEAEPIFKERDESNHADTIT